jgi:hypothetical protein
MFCQQHPLFAELILQHTTYEFIVHHWSIQLEAVVPYGMARTDMCVVALHHVQHEIVDTTTCKVIFFTNIDVTVLKTMDDNTLPFLKDSKCTLNILAYAFKVC